jgi:hypothetical protein
MDATDPNREEWSTLELSTLGIGIDTAIENQSDADAQAQHAAGVVAGADMNSV